jgi:hypothetical protein
MARTKKTPSDTYRGLTDPVLTMLTGVKRWNYFRQRMLERDNYTCQLCFEPVELATLDLDHIVQQALGGPAMWDNLRATHKRCNRRRGSLDARDNRRQYMADWVDVEVDLPARLRRFVSELAKEERRTFNNQLVYIVEQGLKAREQECPRPRGARRP